MSRRISMLLGALFVTFLWSTSLGHAADPAGEPSSLVFSNGGRILEVRADGTDRKVIYGGMFQPVNGRLGATEPAVSPDGTKVAFTFRRETGSSQSSAIWMTGRNGKGATRLLKSEGRVRYGDPTFTPDGELVVSFLKVISRQRAETGLLQVAANGTIEERVYVKKMRWKKRRFDWAEVREPKFSPDGGKVLFALSAESWSELFEDAYGTNLMVLDLASGKVRKIAEQALGGDWSPDGKRIVYSAATWDEDLELCWPGEAACTDGAHLEIIGTDGKDRRKLLKITGDQRSPDWSPDGRILFQASNVRGAGESTEIHSVLPNGTCHSQLTNGSPASTDPAWVEAGNAGPGICGAVRPAPMFEVKAPNPKGALRNMLWAGHRVDTRVFTGFEYDGSLPYLIYSDCQADRPSRCGKPFWMVNFPVCEASSLLELVSGKVDRHQRGVPVVNQFGHELGQMTFVSSGRFITLIVGGSKGGVREVSALRQLSEEKAEGKLPVPLLPARLVKRMKRVLRVFESTGSVKRTAQRLDIYQSSVHVNLQASRWIRAFGDYGTTECPRRSSADR